MSSSNRPPADPEVRNAPSDTEVRNAPSDTGPSETALSDTGPSDTAGYGDYLRLDTLLSCQHPVRGQHDEMLFIRTPIGGSPGVYAGEGPIPSGLG